MTAETREKVYRIEPQMAMAMVPAVRRSHRHIGRTSTMVIHIVSALQLPHKEKTMVTMMVLTKPASCVFKLSTVFPLFKALQSSSPEFTCLTKQPWPP